MEKVKPIKEVLPEQHGTHGYNVVCGSCGMGLFPSNYFCGYCGEAVDWEAYEKEQNAMVETKE